MKIAVKFNEKLKIELKLKLKLKMKESVNWKKDKIVEVSRKKTEEKLKLKHDKEANRTHNDPKKR